MSYLPNNIPLKSDLFPPQPPSEMKIAAHPHQKNSCKSLLHSYATYESLAVSLYSRLGMTPLEIWLFKPEQFHKQLFTCVYNLFLSSAHKIRPELGPTSFIHAFHIYMYTY